MYIDRKNIKHTHWWNEEVKGEVKKKEKWKIYFGNRTKENFEDYKKLRKTAKVVIIRAKENAWKILMGWFEL